MELKKCTKCNIEKELIEFPFRKRRGYYNSYCKSCKNKQASDRRKNNLDKFRSNDKINRLKYKDKKKIYYQDNKERIHIVRTKYRLNNLDKINKRERERRLKDDMYKSIRNLRGRINGAFNRSKWQKNKGTEILLGCDFQTAKNHIEKQFTKGMDWKNNTRLGWHIDHIIPLASAKTKEELIKLCNYTNLQPLWAFDNISKGDKI